MRQVSAGSALFGIACAVFMSTYLTYAECKKISTKARLNGVAEGRREVEKQVDDLIRHIAKLNRELGKCKQLHEDNDQ